MSPLDHPPFTATTPEVGYGNPPKESQWKKGQSGNPAGKKKGTKNFGNQFQKAASKLVTVKEGDKTKKVTLMELLVNAPLVHGINGDMKNAAHALKLAEEFGAQVTDEPAAPKPGTITMGDDGKPKIPYWITDEEVAEFDKFLKDIKNHTINTDQLLDSENNSDLAE